MDDNLNADSVPSLLLNRYRVEGLLGEGGLGTVVKAFDTRLKNMRAIKTLKRTVTSDPDVFRGLEERFTREAEAGSRTVINPNLVAVYDLVADVDSTLYLILEYVSGGTLVKGMETGVPIDKDGKPCDNTKKGTTNADYRNQIVARLADGTEKQLTTSPTFKYHISISPDGTAVAFTAITMSDYNAAVGTFNSNTGNWKACTGYTTDVYMVRMTGGAEVKVSTTGGGHHPSWQRDIPVKIPARPTPEPTVAPTVPPTSTKRP